MDASTAWFRQSLQRIRARWPAWGGVLVIAVGATIFSVLVSEILVTRYEAFETFAWDLGVFNQAFSTTASGHGFFYYTADLPSGNGGHLFVSHFSPLLVLLLPLYELAPGPPTLLVLETVAVGLTAIPLYVFARVELGSERWALFLAIVCLASPLLLGIVWYDFHEEAFLPVTIVSTVVCYRLRSWKWFLATWFLTLAVIESAAPLLLAFGVLAVAGDYVVGQAPYRAAIKRIPWVLWVALLGAVAWTLTVGFIVPALYGLSSSSGAYAASYGINFQILGASSITTVLPTALLHPGAAGAALSYDGSRKATYLLILFGSFAFLPFVGKLRYLLPALIWPLLAVFANNVGYFSFGDQYAAYTLPFVMLGAIDGFARVRAWYRRASETEVRASSEATPGPASAPPEPPGLPRRRHPWVPRTVFVVAVAGLLVGLGATTALVSPLNATPIDNLGVPHGFPTVTAHAQFLHTLIGMIPATAGVLTSQSLFPEVSSRPNAFVLPVSSYFASPRTFWGVVDSYVNASDYVLYDTTADAYSAAIMQQFVNTTGFGVRAEGEGALLYERGWTLPPQLWIPESLNASGGSLATLPAYNAGQVGSYPNVLYYPGGSANGTQLWDGPYFPLVPGSYRVTFTYRVLGTGSVNALRIAVRAQPIVISVVPTDVSSSGMDYSVTEHPSPQKVTLAEANVTATAGSGPTNLTFTVSWPTPSLLDLAGFSLSSSSPVFLYAVSVTQSSTS